MDKDGDGRLARDETSGLMKRFFDQNDSDKDGYLDAKELRQLAQRLATRNRPQNNYQSVSDAKIQSQVPESVEAKLSIAYREGNQAWQLDLFKPKTPSSSPRPAIVFVHGGGWRSGDKRAANFVGPAMQYASKYLDRGMQPIFDGKLYVDPIADHVPTESEPWISGRFIKEAGRFMEVQVGDKVYEIGTQGHDGQHRIMGLLTHRDIKPFIQQAFVHGQMKGDVFLAHEVGIRMLENPDDKDDPKLGRYLFIDDSISGNSDKALRRALKGKLNVYHPPTNCGPVSKGVANIVQWLGAYDQAGCGWDVISFNFGHWDSANTRSQYQADLEKVIAELKKTKAKLVFVTTTPIPRGYPGPGELAEGQKAPGRVQQTMQRHINPWALEVMARHDEIAICDQHSLIMNEKFYAAWLDSAGTKEKGQSNPFGDLHLGGLLGEPVGRQLARKVLDVLGRADEALSHHSLTEADLDPNRQRAPTKGMDVADFLDLLNNNKRLRKYHQ
jgi:hypothetical protein